MVQYASELHPMTVYSFSVIQEIQSTIQAHSEHQAFINLRINVDNARSEVRSSHNIVACFYQTLFKCPHRHSFLSYIFALSLTPITPSLSIWPILCKSNASCPTTPSPCHPTMFRIVIHIRHGRPPFKSQLSFSLLCRIIAILLPPLLPKHLAKC